MRRLLMSRSMMVILSVLLLMPLMSDLAVQTASADQGLPGSGVASTNSGPPGQVVKITLSDFLSQYSVTALFCSYGGHGFCPEAGYTSELGTYNIQNNVISVVIPSDAPTGPGDIEVDANSGIDIATSTANIPFTVTSPPPPKKPAQQKTGLSVSPSKGLPGTAVTLTGRGFVPNTSVTINFSRNVEDKTVLGNLEINVNVNSAGSFSKRWTVPKEATPGVDTFGVLGSNSTLASTNFTVEPTGNPLPATPPGYVLVIESDPGGTWMTPNNGVISNDTIPFRVHAKDNNLGGRGIKYVNFTALYGGGWHVVRQQSTANGGGDIYFFNWKVPNTVPAGQITVSFDVYDKEGNKTLAPNGEHHVMLKRAKPSYLYVPPESQKYNVTYANSAYTILVKGCALTTEAMILEAYGVHQLPGTGGLPLTVVNLNKYFESPQHPGYDGIQVLWSSVETLSAAAGHPLYLVPYGGKSFIGNVDGGLPPGFDWHTRIIQDLNNQHPPIVGIVDKYGNSHFVVATAPQGNTFTIRDPNGRFSTLEGYRGAGYTVAQIVEFVPTSAMAAGSSSFQTVSDETSRTSLDLYVSATAHPVITDAAGRKTGFAPGASKVVNQIPGSGIVYMPPIANDDGSRLSPSDVGMYIINIATPASGGYHIEYDAPAGKTYQSTIYTINQDGSPTIVRGKATSTGKPASQSFNYSPTPPTQSAQQAQAPEKAQPGCVFYTQTVHNLCGNFAAYWMDFGGLAMFGYPITSVFQENGLAIQYFERARFELHPGAWPSHFDVELGLLGDQTSATARQQSPAAFAPITASNDANCTFYQETGHRLCFGFRAYWQSHGGLAVFGYPISEEFVENGVTVQYFERERLEYHPGNKPPYDILLGLLGSQVLTGQSNNAGPTPPASPPTTNLTTVASGLNTPYSLTPLVDGNLLVAEAGTGGDTCKDLPSSEAQGQTVKTCFGNTGSIVELDPVTGKVTPKISGIASSVAQTSSTGTTMGVTGVSSSDGQNIYYVTGLGDNPSVRSQMPGDFGDQFGHLFKVDSKGNTTEVANISAVEANSNPSGGPVDSNPYALVDLGSKQIVADAGGNDLLQVNDDGSIQVVTTFKDLTVNVPADMQSSFGGKTTITEEPVPDALALGPDGAYYVGLLTGGPFIPGAASVIRVDPKTGEQTTYASGFSNIISVAFGPDGSLFVLELAKNGSLDIGGGSALYQVSPNGAKSLVASDGLAMSTSVVVAPNGDLFLTTMALVPGQGQIVKISR